MGNLWKTICLVAYQNVTYKNLGLEIWQGPDVFIAGPKVDVLLGGVDAGVVLGCEVVSVDERHVVGDDLQHR